MSAISMSQEDMKAIVADPAADWTRNPSEIVNKKYFANPTARLPKPGIPVQIMYMRSGIYTDRIAYCSWHGQWIWWDSGLTIMCRVLAWRPCPPKLIPEDFGKDDASDDTEDID